MAGSGLLTYSGGPLTQGGVIGDAGEMGLIGFSSVGAHMVIPRAGQDLVFPFEGLGVGAFMTQNMNGYDQKVQLFYCDDSYMPPPFGSCGVDTTEDALDECKESIGSCQE